MYVKILQNVAALVALISKQQKTGREENKVQFLEEQFHNEKLSFAHRTRTELSFELSQ